MRRTCLALALLAVAASAQAPKRLAAWKIGGEGGWDYVTVDPEAGRLYVPRGTRVTVLDLAGKPLGEISNTPGVHGVALAPELDRGYTSNGRSDTLTIFQASTLKVLKEVKATGANPDAILYDPTTRRVFSFNGRGQNATVFDATSGDVLGSIPMGGKPEFAVADGRGRVFVNIEDTHELLALDTKTMKVLHRWPLTGLEDPTGLALDAIHRRLFAVGSNARMAVMDADTGKVVATLPIGQGADGAAFDPGTNVAYSSNGEGTLTVIREDDADHFTVLAQVPTQRGARTMALDPKTHRIYLPAAEYTAPPAATPDNPHPRPGMAPGSFQILVMGI